MDVPLIDIPCHLIIVERKNIQLGEECSNKRQRVLTWQVDSLFGEWNCCLAWLAKRFMVI